MLTRKPLLTLSNQKPALDSLFGARVCIRTPFVLKLNFPPRNPFDLTMTTLIATALILGGPALQRPQVGSLKVGDLAPISKAAELGSEKVFDVASVKDKPVVLIFGSCT
jgi:hypothetical protein